MKNEIFTADGLKEISGKQLLRLYEEHSKINEDMTGYKKMLWEEISRRLK